MDSDWSEADEEALLISALVEQYHQSAPASISADVSNLPRKYTCHLYPAERRLGLFFLLDD